MKRTTISLIIAGFIVLVTHVARVQAQREFVGYAGGAVPNAGVLALDRLCHQQFPNAHMCRSSDILANGTSLSTVPDGLGWVLPTIVAADSTTTLDASGTASTSPGRLSCNAWSSDAITDTGLIFFSDAASGVSGFGVAVCPGLVGGVSCCADPKKKK